MSDDHSEQGAPSQAEAGDGTRLPTVSELREVVAREQENATIKVEQEWTKRFRSISIEAREKYAHLKGLQDHYKHKGRWSSFLMIVMAFMIGFQSYLLYMVGISAWDFTKYEWLLPVLLVQNLAQIVGLAVFVVKALFKDMK